MAKLLVGHSESGERQLFFYCPGCKNYHVFGESWWWNGDMEKPTFSPSLLCGYTSGRRCHSFVRDGKIEYSSDCHHELAGHTVEMLDESELQPTTDATPAT